MRKLKFHKRKNFPHPLDEMRLMELLTNGILIICIIGSAIAAAAIVFAAILP